MAASKADQPRTDGKFAAKSVRAHAMPVVVYGVVLVSASILHAVSLGSGQLIPAGIIAAAGALALLALRSRPGAAKFAAAVSAVWAMAWMLMGPSWALFTLGSVATGILGIPWWRNHHIPNLLPVLAAAEADTETVIDIPVIVEAEPSTDDVLMAKWDARIADDGQLKGVPLTHLETDERGNVHKFLVQLGEGKQTYETLLGAKSRIAGAMNVPQDNVVTERHEEDASKAILTVVTGLDLGKVKYYTRPMYDPATGTVEAGGYVDDDAGAVLSIIVRNGMYGVTFCGAQGTGKSQCMEQVVLSLLASGLFVLMYIDPQGGMSSPMLAKAAKWSATTVEEGLELLRRLPRMRQYRQAKLARADREGFTPTPEMPGVIVAIDEFQEMAAIPEARAILNKLAKTFRKVGMALFIATQDLGLEAFGGDQSLRTQLTAKNVVYFATPSKVQGHLTGRNEFDPSTLPMVPGYGYLKEVRDDEGNLLTRAAPFRALYFGARGPDEENAGVRWYKRLRASCRFAELDFGSAGALGSRYRDRDKIHREQIENADALIAACERAGQGLADDDELEDVFNPGAGRGKADDAAAVLDFGVGLGGSAAVAADRAANLDGVRKHVLTAIRSGAATPADMKRYVDEHLGGVSKSWVEQHLQGSNPNNLIDAGLVTRIDRGHYHANGFEMNCGKCGGTVANAAEVADPVDDPAGETEPSSSDHTTMESANAY